MKFSGLGTLSGHIYCKKMIMNKYL